MSGRRYSGNPAPSSGNSVALSAVAAKSIGKRRRRPLESAGLGNTRMGSEPPASGQEPEGVGVRSRWAAASATAVWAGPVSKVIPAASIISAWVSPSGAGVAATGEPVAGIGVAGDAAAASPARGDPEAARAMAVWRTGPPGLAPS